MEELKVYVVSGTVLQSKALDNEKIGLMLEKGNMTTSQLNKRLKLDLKGGLPTLQDVVKAIQKDLTEAGVSEWSATIELEVKVGTGSIIPGGSAGIKTTVNIKGKPAETK